MKKFLVFSLLAALIAPSTYSSLYCQNASKATSGLENTPSSSVQAAPAVSPNTLDTNNCATNINLNTKTGETNALSCTVDSATDGAKASTTESDTTQNSSSSEIPEPQIPFSPEGTEKVTINGIEYWQKTVHIPKLPELESLPEYTGLANQEEHKTIIYTLDGQEVGYIDYCIYREHKKKIGKKKKYGHIGYLLVHEPFRKKLGIGKHLFKQAIYFFHKSNLLTIKWLACPHHLSPEDQKVAPADRLWRLIAFYESLGGKIEGEQNDSSASMVYIITPKAFPRCRYPIFY